MKHNIQHKDLLDEITGLIAKPAIDLLVEAKEANMDEERRQLLIRALVMAYEANATVLRAMVRP